MLSFSSQPLTVGAITDNKALAQTFDLTQADLIELRLDSLGIGHEVIEFAKRHHGSIPLLFTARDPLEGGTQDLPLVERNKQLEALLPFASAIDLELRNFEAYRPLVEDIKKEGLKLILSNHNFNGFDHLATIEALSQAQALGADVAKAAVTLKDPVDLILFESLLVDLDESPFSLMGMGAYGPVSRVLAAQHGSLLNYGYLGNEPTAPGQWPASLLKEVIAQSPRF